MTEDQVEWRRRRLRQIIAKHPPRCIDWKNCRSSQLALVFFPRQEYRKKRRAARVLCLACGLWQDRRPDLMTV